MEIKDLIITPLYLFLFTLGGYFIRPYVTNERTKKYFLPALWVRFAGALLLGVMYQFYYGGGDTFNYFTNGSKWIYEAFQDDFFIGLKLLLEPGNKWDPQTFEYTEEIWYYRSSSSYAIVKLVALIDLFTFHTYSATALFFAIINFSGLWALYSALQRCYPNHSKKLALAILFVPSVVFWGSGILKDTITLGALGWMTWALLSRIELGKRSILGIISFTISFMIIWAIKKYILICFIPMIAVWIFFKYSLRIKNFVSRLLLIPVLIALFSLAGYFSFQQVAGSNDEFALAGIAEQARITAYDIRYGWGTTFGGQGGYDIGLPDGTISGLIEIAPAAINVSLFRPYLWEVKNPLMLMAALESIVMMVLFIRFLVRGDFKNLTKEPFLIFCLLFVLLFGWAVGASTFNFGTLIRYKIPMIPFMMVLLLTSSRRHHST